MPSSFTVNKTNDFESSTTQQERLSDIDSETDCKDIVDKIDVRQNTQPNICGRDTNIHDGSETESVDENDVEIINDNTSIENEERLLIINVVRKRFLSEFLCA